MSESARPVATLRSHVETLCAFDRMADLTGALAGWLTTPVIAGPAPG